MQLMLNEYIHENAFTSIKWTIFREKVESYIDNNWSEKYEARKLKDMIDWMTWVYGPGLPPYTANFTTPALVEAVSLAHSYVDLGGNGSPANFSDYKTWNSNT